MVLLAEITAQKEENTRLLNELNLKMRGFLQNYLELAAGYVNYGFAAEAETVLLRCPEEDPMVNYWLGWLNDLKGNKTLAAQYFTNASAISTDYVFPFRAEDEKVLLKAAEYVPTDAKPLYYLGNLLYDKQPGRAIEYWEKAVQFEPSMAIAWRNLGWGYNQHKNDIQKSIAAYEKAFSLKKDEPVYYAELDVLYETNNTPLATRAKLFESANDIVKQRDDAFVRQILVLNLTGQVEKSVEYLENSNFHFREGSSRISDMTVDARLLLGSKLMKEGKYQHALEQFLAAMKREAEDERAGARDPQINYFTGLAYEALGEKRKGKSYFEKSVGQDLSRTEMISYYQGLSWQKLGNRQKSDEIFRKLVAEGTQMLESSTEPDFFAKFGERSTGNARLSNARLLIALGYKGLGETGKAKENLEQAVSLSVSNLWAGVELGGL
jgi:tetratricopeptide (TPR) repeat protein